MSVEKGRPFVQIEVGGKELRALLDTGASHNFLTVEEAKRLGIPYEKEMGWLKAVNSTPNLIHGVARDTKVRIGDWHGTLDFFVVSMDDSPCILGVEFVDRAKAIPMLFANSMCITAGGGTCVVPLLRGKASNTLATMHVEMHDPSSAAQGEKQHGKGGGTPKKDLKECKRGHTPKLQKGQPPREKVDCARGNAVARSPKEESPPRQEGPRRHRSRKSRRKCKAEGRAGALSHRDEGGTAGAQLEKARSNTVVHAGRHGRRGRFSRCNSLWGEGKVLLGGNVCGSRFSGQTGQSDKQESCREEQAKMRLSLPTARQNEVQRGWRRAGRLLGRAGRWEAQNEVHGPSLAHNGPVGRAGRVGAARGQTRRETRFIAWERERGKGRGARDAVEIQRKRLDFSLESR
ncbi:hypothetical protein GH714_027757 [Hevea brasiliensis]|uniref:Peptidase A2 domain-containing protein n=1 Tax=Hevea brasiliensis TaxID=3981 RepID=A0A6A6KUB8_HEVBR|nr:hypothetical protein GH714_027757 [Hevea brasiliensis]